MESCACDENASNRQSAAVQVTKDNLSLLTSKSVHFVVSTVYNSACHKRLDRVYCLAHQNTG